MKRYYVTPTIFHTLHEEESDNGQWVKFEEANARIKKLEDILNEARLQLEFLNEVQRRGTTNSVLSRIQTVLNK